MERLKTTMIERYDAQQLRPNLDRVKVDYDMLVTDLAKRFDLDLNEFGDNPATPFKALMMYIFILANTGQDEVEGVAIWAIWNLNSNLHIQAQKRLEQLGSWVLTPRI